MRRWVVGGIVVLLLVMAVGVVLTYIPKVRQSATEVACRNNLRDIGLFAVHHAQQVGLSDPKETPIPPAVAGRLVPEIPAGTVFVPGLPPEDRLSWYVPVLPGLDQKRQPLDPLLTAIDVAGPWSAERNQRAGRTRLAAALCPGNPPGSGPDDPAPTSYVGIAGLGPDAATLLLPNPLHPPPPRAGCFRYDAPTPFDAITDGLSQTLLIGERSGDVGPWLRGGPSTVRGIDDRPDAAALLGAGAQFGGCHPNGAVWGFADGSARFLTDRTDRKLLFGWATIAGGEKEFLRDE